MATFEALGYANKNAFKAQKPKINTSKMPSYRQAKGAKGTKEWSYGELTSDEREGWKVKHGIAPTAADPSAGGVAEREEAKIAKSRGLLSKKEIRAKKVVKTREIDKAKYYAGIKAAQLVRMKYQGIADSKARKAKQNAMPNAWKKDFGRRGISGGGASGASDSSRSISKMAKASSNFGFAGRTSTGNSFDTFDSGTFSGISTNNIL